MQKLFITILTLATLTISFSSCNTYHSIQTANNVRQLSANPFAQKVARSVLHNISDKIIDKNITSFKGKPMMASRLSALLNTTESVDAFKTMISNTYGISQKMVDENFGSWATVREVIAFVAANGQRYNFNSYSNKLY